MDRVKELVSQAKELGVQGSLIRANLNDPDKLAEIVKIAEQGARAARKAQRVSKVKSSKGGSKVARPVARAKAKAKAKVTPKRGRPVGSKNKPKTTTKTTARKSTPVRKPTRTTARKTTTARKPAPKTTARKPARKGSDEPKRNTLGRPNFSKTDGWNPREGSAVEEIWLALKRAKGDRDKAFEALKKDVWLYVGKTKADGTKRPRTEEAGGAYHMLRYRISRTLFDFMLQTDQHDVAEGRVPYGSGTNGNKSKPARKAAVTKATKRTATKPARKPATKATTAKRGRPKGSTNKPKPAQTRTTRRRTSAGRR